jgi:hypothetical protein
MKATKRTAKPKRKPVDYSKRAWDMELLGAGFPEYFDDFEWAVAWLGFVRPSGWRTIRLERDLPPKPRFGRRSLHLGWNGGRFARGADYDDLCAVFPYLHVELIDALDRFDSR